MIGLRPASGEDHAFLEEMLHTAIYVPDGEEPPPRSIVSDPDLRRYVEDFGHREGDAGLIAMDQGVPIGAVWVRRFPPNRPGYGFVDEATPELSIAVKETERDRGVGTTLLESMLASVPRVSLSVDRRNRAIRLYRRLGFEPFSDDGGTVTMLRVG